MAAELNGCEDAVTAIGALTSGIGIASPAARSARIAVDGTAITVGTTNAHVNHVADRSERTSHGASFERTLGRRDACPESVGERVEDGIHVASGGLGVG